MNKHLSFTNKKTAIASVSAIVLTAALVAVVSVPTATKNSSVLLNPNIGTTESPVRTRVSSDTMPQEETVKQASDETASTRSTKSSAPPPVVTSTTTVQQPSAAPAPVTLVSRQQIGATNSDYSCMMRYTYSDGHQEDKMVAPSTSAGSGFATACLQPISTPKAPGA